MQRRGCTSRCVYRNRACQCWRVVQRLIDPVGRWGRTWNTVRSAGRPRHVVGFDQQNPNYCYQWRERSADGGITWEEMNTLPKGAIIAGISLSNGKVLYAMSPEFVNDIYRSTDQGSSWERVIQADIKLNSPMIPIYLLSEYIQKIRISFLQLVETED